MVITGDNIPRVRYMTLYRGLKLEIDTGMSIGRRSASAIIKSEFGWPKSLSKKSTLAKFKVWMMDNVYPMFGDIVFLHKDGITGEEEWRYIRRGVEGYYSWNAAFAAEAGMTAQQLYDQLVEQGLTQEIIDDMVAQSMFKWRVTGEEA
jgi:hypothetical protein